MPAALSTSPNHLVPPEVQDEWPVSSAIDRLACATAVFAANGVKHGTHRTHRGFFQSITGLPFPVLDFSGSRFTSEGPSPLARTFGSHPFTESGFFCDAMIESRPDPWPVPPLGPLNWQYAVPQTSESRL